MTAAGKERPRFSVLTIFPEALRDALKASLLGKAQGSGALAIDLVDIRDFAAPPHRSTDDAPFGGGAGMVMKAEPLVAAIESVRTDGARVILLSPDGRPFKQAVANELSQLAHVVLVCGRYEGVDQRVRDHFVDDVVSIGDYVLGGGEAAAWVVIEATARLLPGVVGNARSVEDESFADGLLDFPQYTRPRVFRGHEVPDVLLSGDHAKIAAWRRRARIERTRALRPDLFAAWNAGKGEGDADGDT